MKYASRITRFGIHAVFHFKSHLSGIFNFLLQNRFFLRNNEVLNASIWFYRDTFGGEAFLLGGGVFLTPKQVLGPGPRMGPHPPDLRGPVGAPAGVPGRRQLRDPTQIVRISLSFFHESLLLEGLCSFQSIDWYFWARCSRHHSVFYNYHLLHHNDSCIFPPLDWFDGHLTYDLVPPEEKLPRTSQLQIPELWRNLEIDF